MHNMKGNDPSPFEEMNVIQAKNNIDQQKLEIRKSAATDIFEISNLDHLTIIKWCNMILEKGEVEANRWINSRLEN